MIRVSIGKAYYQTSEIKQITKKKVNKIAKLVGDNLFDY